MSVKLRAGLSLCCTVAVFGFMNQAGAEEKNFGKSLPTTETVIEQFKVNSSEATDSVQSEEGDSIPGGKSRGLKKIGVGHATSKPDTHRVAVAKAAVPEKSISLEILFDYNSAVLTADAKLQLVPVGGAMASEDLKGLHYRIEGHTDVVGGNEFNIDLSRRRAEAVKQFLIEQYGISASAVDVVGKGKSDLADEAHPTSEANRRVRIVRLSN